VAIGDISEESCVFLFPLKRVLMFLLFCESFEGLWCREADLAGEVLELFMLLAFARLRVSLTLSSYILVNDLGNLLLF